jgi:hypothetical protein
MARVFIERISMEDISSSDHAFGGGHHDINRWIKIILMSYYLFDQHWSVSCSILVHIIWFYIRRFEVGSVRLFPLNRDLSSFLPSYRKHFGDVGFLQRFFLVHTW